MKEKAFPNGRVILQHHKGDDWRVDEKFCFYWEAKGRLVCVWEDFITDQATTPSFIPDFIIDNTGAISNGATPHDMIYKLLAHSEGIPFYCIYVMLNGQYWTKTETDKMFAAANLATGEMGWIERWIAKRVRWNFKAKWNWMTEDEWRRRVFLMKRECV